jgi:hypothetical protein
MLPIIRGDSIQLDGRDRLADDVDLKKFPIAVDGRRLHVIRAL